MLRVALWMVSTALLLEVSVSLCAAGDDRPLAPAHAARAAQAEIAKILKVTPEEVRVVSTRLLPDHHRLHRTQVREDTAQEPNITEAVLVKLELPERTSDCGMRVVLVARDGVRKLSSEFSKPARDPMPITRSECLQTQREVNDFFRAMYDLRVGLERFAGRFARQAAIRESLEQSEPEPNLPPEVARSILAAFLDDFAGWSSLVARWVSNPKIRKQA